MSTTLTPSTFRVTISEEQIVKNNIIQNDSVYSISNVTNVDRRIVTIPSNTPTTIFNLGNPDPGPGTFSSSSLKYARITNLDDSWNIYLTVSGSTARFTQELRPKSSAFFVSSNITSSAFNSTFGDDITSIKISTQNGINVDVEYTIVNT